jgi:hypothetical protein
MLNNNYIKSLTNIIKDIISIQIIQPAFWFRNQGAASFLSVEILGCLIFFGMVFLLGVFILAFNRWRFKNYPPKNKIFGPVGAGLLGFGVAGIVFTLIRSQGVSFLGARIFLLVFTLASIVWALYFIRRYFRDLPAQIVKYEAGALKKKYLSKTT